MSRHLEDCNKVKLPLKSGVVDIGNEQMNTVQADDI